VNRYGGSQHGKLNILIVEDSPTQALQLQYILEQHGYQCSVAQNGSDAIAFMRQHKPTAVISDILMPEMDGYQLCQRIKGDADLTHIPVILLTSLADPRDVIRGLECGADNFIVKPYDEQFLLGRIQYILANQQLRREETTPMGLEIFFAGQTYFITSDRLQILNLLLSTYETAVQKNRQLIQTQEAL
jgi:DNA-binding response OmpR family regulator